MHIVSNRQVRICPVMNRRATLPVPFPAPSNRPEARYRPNSLERHALSEKAQPCAFSTLTASLHLSAALSLAAS